MKYAKRSAEANSQQSTKKAGGVSGSAQKQVSEARSPKTGWGPVSAILITALVYFGSQLLAGLSIGLYGSITGKDSSELARAVEGSVVYQFSFMLLVAIFSLFLLWLFFKKRQIKLADIGLGRNLKLSDVGGAVLVFGLYFLALILVLSILGEFVPGVDLDQEQQIGFDGAEGLQLALVFASLVLLPPIVEEIMVRGFLYGGLRNKLTPIVAAILASAIFGTAHLQFGSGEALLWVAAIDTFVLSLFLIYLREKTGALYSGMIVHFLKNGLAFVSLFIIKLT